MLELYTINRCALLLRPSKVMIDWVNTIFPTHPVSYEKHIKQGDNTDVFLIPEYAFLEDAKDWLKNNYIPIFESALEDWCTDEDLWPKSLDWETFERFFDYSIQSSVQDTVSEEEDMAYEEED